MVNRRPGFMRNREPNVHKRDKQHLLSTPPDRQRPRDASGPASLPDEVWDVFRLDELDARDEPEPGDFWWEPDDASEQ
jgi:hypothetical protein